MRRIDKTLVILTKQETEQIKFTVEQRDRTRALWIVKDMLGKKIELMLKKRCK